MLNAILIVVLIIFIMWSFLWFVVVIKFLNSNNFYLWIANRLTTRVKEKTCWCWNCGSFNPTSNICCGKCGTELTKEK